MTCLRNFIAGSAIVFLVLGVLGVALPSFASTDFSVPPGRASNPIAMTLGPDGNLWFAESSNQKIGYTTTSGAITEFPIPNAQSLFGVARDPMATSGSRTRWLVSSAASAPPEGTSRPLLYPRAPTLRESLPDPTVIYGSSRSGRAASLRLGKSLSAARSPPTRSV